MNARQVTLSCHSTRRVLALGYEHVFFLPWIGGGFRDPGFRGRRLLILGEAHYDTWFNKSAGVCVRHDLPPEFTQTCVQKVIERHGAPSYWRRIQNRVGGAEFQGQRHPADFWQAVAFSNYVQSGVEGGPGVRPTAAQWDQARLALQELIAELQPERIICLGYDLWQHLPPRDGQGEDLERNGRRLVVEWFDLSDGQKTFVTFTAHPRGSDFDRAMEPVLDAFIRQHFEGRQRS